MIVGDRVAISDTCQVVQWRGQTGTVQSTHFVTFDHVDIHFAVVALDNPDSPAFTTNGVHFAADGTLKLYPKELNEIGDDND